MKKKLFALFALFAALLSGSAQIQAQTKTAAVVVADDNSALLYEITGKDLKKPSYLFGTIHLICQKDMFAEDKLNAYFDKTEQLILELDMDDPSMVPKMAKLAVLADGKSVKDMIKPDEYARIDELFKNYVGISYDQLQNFKPITAQTFLLSSPKVLGCQPPVVYDQFLAQTAVTRKKPVIGLETVEEQMMVIDSQPLEEQIRQLKEAAANPEKGFGDFKALYRTYLTQNADDIYKLIETQMKTYKMAQPILLDNRNQNWIPLIEKNISTTSSFIAVGGGHLGGKNGVVNLLRAKGYKVTPIKL